MGLLIDSSAIIASARGKFSFPELIRRYENESMAISAITASELLHGIYRSRHVEIIQRRREFVESVFELLPIIPFDLAIARLHAQLWANLQTNGRMIGAHDLQIAATALTIGFSVVTLNEREFGLIPNLIVLNPT